MHKNEYRVKAASAGQSVISHARDQFIETGQISPCIRPVTARSWRRCALAGLTPDRTPRPLFIGEVDEGGALLRAARSVAGQLIEEIGDDSVAMLVVNRDGRILGRWASASALDQLDEISARPGFQFDELSIGTSALGTSIEENAAVLVSGAEHFVTLFDGLCAAGAPILHPATGRLEGAIDIVCRVGCAESFMLPLISRAAREIQECLLHGQAAADRLLLDALLRVDRRGPRRPSVALNSRIMIANSLGGDLVVGANGHTVLWEQVQRAVRSGTKTLALNPDALADPLQAVIRPVMAPDGILGAVLHLHRDETSDQLHGLGRSREDEINMQRLRAALPGRSAAWLQVLRQAALAVNGGHLLIVGPGGVGKGALAEAVAKLSTGAVASWDARVNSFDELGVVAGRTHDGIASVLVMRHLDTLDDVVMGLLARRLESGSRKPRVVIGTYCTDSGPPRGRIVSLFEHLVDVPGLDERREDIPDLVTALLAQEGYGSTACRPDALQELINREWPGNARQLKRVLQSAASRAAPYSIGSGDLPANLRIPPGRPLAPLQRAERDVLYAALTAAGGNRRKAADALGISRSTFYRKIAALGMNS